MKKIWIVLFALGATTILSSCKKYDEGPLLSLRTRTARVANAWEVDKAYRNGSDVTGDYDQFELDLLQNNDAELAAIYSFGDISFEFQTSGEWSFEDRQENLKLDFENDDADRTYKILRLKEDELWLEELGGEDELHLIPR